MLAPNAPAKYFTTLDLITRPRSNFDAALCALLAIKPRTGIDGQRDGRRARMIAALNGQASWRQIRRWRRNESPAPQWAFDLVESKITARQQELAHGKNLLENLKR